MENIQEKVRVSFMERAVPFLGFVTAAIGGGFGAWYLYSFVSRRLADPSLSLDMMSHHVIGSTSIALISLYVSVVLVFAGIVIAAVRIFTTNTNASPLGLSYLLVGILNLVPVALLWYGASYIIGIFDPVNPSGKSGFARITLNYSLAAMIVAPFVALLSAIWSVMPFRSRLGRRYGPLISLTLIEAMLFFAAIMYTWRLLWLLENVKT